MCTRDNAVTFWREFVFAARKNNKKKQESNFFSILAVTVSAARRIVKQLTVKKLTVKFVIICCSSNFITRRGRERTNWTMFYARLCTIASREVCRSCD